MKKFLVEDDSIDTRLDRWFKRKIHDVPQSFIEKNLRKGNIKVNKKKNRSSYKLQKNDQIYVSDFKFSTIKSKKNTMIINLQKRNYHFPLTSLLKIMKTLL